MTTIRVYEGTTTRVYPAYLALGVDGVISTLIGEPGGSPMKIIRAGGNTDIPPVPDDGWWADVKIVQDEPADSASPAKKIRKVTN